MTLGELTGNSNTAYLSLTEVSARENRNIPTLFRIWSAKEQGIVTSEMIFAQAIDRAGGLFPTLFQGYASVTYHPDGSWPRPESKDEQYHIGPANNHLGLYMQHFVDGMMRGQYGDPNSPAVPVDILDDMYFHAIHVDIKERGLNGRYRDSIEHLISWSGKGKGIRYASTYDPLFSRMGMKNEQDAPLTIDQVRVPPMPDIIFDYMAAFPDPSQKNRGMLTLGYDAYAGTFTVFNLQPNTDTKFVSSTSSAPITSLYFVPPRLQDSLLLATDAYTGLGGAISLRPGETLQIESGTAVTYNMLKGWLVDDLVPATTT